MNINISVEEIAGIGTYRATVTHMDEDKPNELRSITISCMEFETRFRILSEFLKEVLRPVVS